MNETLVDLIRDVSDRIFCLEELINPLIATAFEFRLDGLLNEPTHFPKDYPNWGQKDNAYEWMNEHYSQINGVLFAMTLILRQAQDIIEQAEVEAYGMVKATI